MKNRLSLAVLFLALTFPISFVDAQVYCKACSNPNFTGRAGSLGAKSMLDHQLQLTFQFNLAFFNTKKAGTKFLENSSNEQALMTLYSLNAIYMLTKGFSFGLGVPIGRLSTQEEIAKTVKKEEVFGMGDMTLSIYYALNSLFPENRKAPQIRAGLGVSLPTGKLAEVNDFGAFNGLAVGRGNFNLLANLFINFTLSKQFSLYLFGNLQHPLNESPQLTFGTSILYGLGSSWQFWPERMGFSLSVKAEHLTKSRIQDRGELVNSGGFKLSATPTLTFTLVKNFQLSVRGNIPFYQYVEGEQLVPNFSITAGLSYSFPSFFPNK